MRTDIKRGIGKVIVGVIILMSLVIIAGAILVSCNASFLTVKGHHNTIADTTSDAVEAEVDDNGILRALNPLSILKKDVPKPLKLISKDTLITKQKADTVKVAKPKK